VCNCSDALRHALRDEAVEQDKEAGDDEGEFCGDGGIALGHSTSTRLSEGRSRLIETLKLEGMWNIVAERKPETEML